MSFNSLSYLLYLPVVFIIYWLLPHRRQNAFLLAASYFFLGFIHPWFALLIFFISSANYFAARAMQWWPMRKKIILVLDLVVSLGVLAYFKYAGFFLENMAALLQAIGLPSFQSSLSILLPVGISFYTFQTIAYTVDVYRGDIPAQKNFIDFSLFISFFPQLVAGPIERSRDLMPQVEHRRYLTSEQVNHGLLLLVWGFFKKLVIADNTGLIAYKVFSLSDPGFYTVWAGVFSFAIQILADFWSYTDIARGSALLLGFKLSRNFNHPYFATSPADFWRRWHMSLSYWLRDYIYIPLGGSRVPAGRATGNIMLTFLLSGLWHGASWNFVLWGGYHGLLVLIHRWWRMILNRLQISVPSRLQPGIVSVKIFLTFLFVCIGWLMFRVTDTGRLLAMLQLVPWHASAGDLQVAVYLFFLCLLYSLPIWLHGFFHLRWCRQHSLDDPLPDSILMVRPLLMAVLFLGILLLRSPAPSTFIYFQF